MLFFQFIILCNPSNSNVKVEYYENLSLYDWSIQSTVVSCGAGQLGYGWPEWDKSKSILSTAGQTRR